MARAKTLALLGDTAQDQWGLITRRQAQRLGIPPTTIARLNGNALERVANGVYRLTGAPQPDLLALRAAWLQLAPATPVWERDAAQGVVSHRSAAAIYGFGDLPADVHEFTLESRRQSRRRDVRLHRSKLTPSDWTTTKGLPITRPARTAADLLVDHADPSAVGQVIADAIRTGHDHPRAFVRALAPFATSLGLRAGDGIGLLAWLLNLVGDPDTPQWIKQARTQLQDESEGADS